MSRQSEYERVQKLATTDEAGGLAKERAVLLLWFLRNVVGLDDLDAYEFICDGDQDGGIDALRLEEPSGEDEHETLVIYQSKYTESPTQVGPRSLDALPGRADRFKSGQSLREFIGQGIEEKLEDLIQRFQLLDKLDHGAFDDGSLKLKLVLVTTGLLNKEARNQVDAINAANRPGYFATYDLRRLGPLAEVVAAPAAKVEKLVVPCAGSDRLITGAKPNRVAVAAVKAKDIAAWEGIEDRRLFSLNVRGELRRNRVSRQLDGAISRNNDHRDFLAFHNGLTMVCESIKPNGKGLEVKKPSIVNGTQSVLALFRGAQDDQLTDDLRIFVKLVEVKGRPQLAKDVSWRSNTQTAVNARNLMALGGPQARLSKEFEERYPDIYYEIRPDASFDSSKFNRVIANDDAAQLLCAVFNAWPWLAVKRLVLFEGDNHAAIFGDEIHAEHIYLVDVIRQVVDENSDEFPQRYRESWRLTRLISVYLVGAVLRSVEALKPVLEDPKSALEDLNALKEKLHRPVVMTAFTLENRIDLIKKEDEKDEFNREFKNRDVLLTLRDQARENFRMAAKVEKKLDGKSAG
jgi:hypothetical protein